MLARSVNLRDGEKQAVKAVLSGKVVDTKVMQSSLKDKIIHVVVELQQRPASHYPS